MKLISLSVGLLATNCYIVACKRTRVCMLIDPGDEAPEILETVDQHHLTVSLIVLTHAHFDHIGGAQAIQTTTGALLAIHAAEVGLLAHPRALFPGMRPPPPLTADRALQAGETLQVGELDIRVLETPGHSPGGISLYIAESSVLFSGDALFREGVGRADLPGSSSTTLAESIRTQLYTLPDETIVYPGHGPETTIGWEKRHNPFVRHLA